MQKISFECNDCEAHGVVRLPDACDEYEVQACPCCGSPLDLSDDYYEDDE